MDDKKYSVAEKEWKSRDYSEQIRRECKFLRENNCEEAKMKSLFAIIVRVIEFSDFILTILDFVFREYLN